VKIDASLAVVEVAEENRFGRVGHSCCCLPDVILRCLLDCRCLAQGIGLDHSLPAIERNLGVDGQRSCGKDLPKAEPVLLGLEYLQLQMVHKLLPTLRWADSSGFALCR